MKKIFIVYAVLIALVIIIAVIKIGGNFSLPFGKKATAEVDGKKINLIVANNDKDRKVGLSNRNSLNSDTGMLFVFDKKEIPSFWMRNMKFPIDIVFINDNKVVEIFKNVQPPEEDSNIAGLKIYKPEEAVNYVLEVPAGTADKNSINAGDTIEFSDLPK